MNYKLARISAIFLGQGTKMWTPYCNITKNMTTTEFTEVNKSKIYNLVEKWT